MLQANASAIRDASGTEDYGGKYENDGAGSQHLRMDLLPLFRDWFFHSFDPQSDAPALSQVIHMKMAEQADSIGRWITCRCFKNWFFHAFDPQSDTLALSSTNPMLCKRHPLLGIARTSSTVSKCWGFGRRGRKTFSRWTGKRHQTCMAFTISSTEQFSNRDSRCMFSGPSSHPMTGRRRKRHRGRGQVGGAGFASALPATTSIPGGICCSTSTFATNCPAAERRPEVRQASLEWGQMTWRGVCRPDELAKGAELPIIGGWFGQCSRLSTLIFFKHGSTRLQPGRSVWEGMQTQTMLLGSNKDCRAIETSTSHYRNTSPCSSKYITSIHCFNIKFPQHHITSPSSLPQQKNQSKKSALCSRSVGFAVFLRRCFFECLCRFGCGSHWGGFGNVVVASLARRWWRRETLQIASPFWRGGCRFGTCSWHCIAGLKVCAV